MIRIGFKPAEPKPSRGPKQIACRNRACRKRFVPDPLWLRCCSEECGVVIGLEAVAKRKAAKEKAERAETKKKLEGFKRLPDHIADTQRAFNNFVRIRDQLAGHPCISSGKPLDWTGNAVDAGHYRSRGSAPHLRFDERNCHAQSKHENRYASGNATGYRVGLIARIGLEEVEALEADNEPRKYSIDELKQIKATYVAKLRQLKGE